MLKNYVNTGYESIFRDPDVIRKLFRLYENFVVIPADKALYFCMNPDRGYWNPLTTGE